MNERELKEIIDQVSDCKVRNKRCEFMMDFGINAAVIVYGLN